MEITTNIIKNAIRKMYNFGVDKVKFVDVYKPVILTCDMHGDFEADPIDCIRGRVICPNCTSVTILTPSKVLKKIPQKYMKDDKLLSVSDIAVVRESFGNIQDNTCPLCNRELDRPVLDHWHIARNNGNGKIRLVLCSTCNTLLGKLENSFPRYKVPYSVAPKWLKNVADYLTMGTTSLIHPTERPTIKMTKNEFNRFKELVSKYEEFNFTYPKLGVLKNSKLLNLYIKYKDKLEGVI